MIAGPRNQHHSDPIAQISRPLKGRLFVVRRQDARDRTRLGRGLLLVGRGAMVQNCKGGYSAAADQAGRAMRPGRFKLSSALGL